MASSWQKKENATGIQFGIPTLGMVYVPYAWLMKIQVDEEASQIYLEFTHLKITVKGKELKEVFTAGCEQTLSLVQSQTGTAAKTFINEITIEEKGEEED